MGCQVYEKIKVLPQEKEGLSKGFFLNGISLYTVPVHEMKNSLQWMRGGCIQFACIHADQQQKVAQEG